MVVISDYKNMFWGVTIDAGKRYSQVVDKGFHVSMAALEFNAKKNSERVQVMLQHESAEYLLCTLHGGQLQQPLDLNFATGEQVSFSLNGTGVVHLTGYLIPEDEGPLFDDESFSEDEEIPSLVDSSGEGMAIVGNKRKAPDSLKKSKKIKLLSQSDSDDDEDDSDDEDYDEDSEEEEGFSDDFEDTGFDWGGSDSEDEDDDDYIEEEDTSPAKKSVSTPKAESQSQKKKSKEGTKTPNQSGKSPKPEIKSPKEVQKTPKQDKKTSKQDEKTPKDSKPGTPAATTPDTPSANGESAKKKKKKKKKKNKDGDSSLNETGGSTPSTTPKAETTPKKRVVAGGTVVEDLKVGHGPEAKPGKMVSVYYVGTLAKNNKRFDSCSEGKPFRFRLNQGEVIKGWDNGVNGMKVGGKRKITVPANQGYGNVKQGPIPPNSTLVFEVELKAVS